MGDVDSVNLFNGNLTLTVPLGQRYPAGGALGYQITLVYNSSLWSYLETSNAFWGGPEDAIEASPSALFNAGLGWTISFGRLIPPTRPPENDSEKWVYVSPDGAQHAFYSRLHSDAPSEESPGVLYSRDNSYLRLRTNTSPKTIEFPDGTIHEFAGAEYALHGLPGFGVTKIRDRHVSANWVAFSYSNPLDWTVTDRFGRTHHVEFTDHDPGAATKYQASRIRLRGFGGTDADYTFAYDAWVEIDRTTRDSWWGNNVPIGSPAAPDPVQVSLLKTITGPEGLVWSSVDAGDGGADYDRGDPNAARDYFSGLIESLTLPTRGRLTWAWRNWTFPQSTKSYRSGNAGVATRAQSDPVRNLSGTWTYASSLYTPAGQAIPTEQISTVVDPLGNTTRHYFWADLDNSADGDWDYGLPFTYRSVATASCGSSCNGKLLSREFIAAGQTNALRSWWVRYEHDTLPTVAGAGEDFWNTNRRVAAERARHHDDATYADSWTESEASDFDGYGHYRLRDERGRQASTIARQSTTEFNPASGCYPACGGFTPILPAAPWVLATFTERRQVEGAFAELQEFQFDGTTGLLACERRRKGSAQRSARIRPESRGKRMMA